MGTIRTLESKVNAAAGAVVPDPCVQRWNIRSPVTCRNKEASSSRVDGGCRKSFCRRRSAEHGIDRMRRRQVMALLGGATLWPFAARAQRSPFPVIGYLSSASIIAPSLDGPVPPTFYQMVRGLFGIQMVLGGPVPPAFYQGLNQAGYFVGRNVAIEAFSADGRYDRLPALADEVVRRQVNLIVAAGGLASARAAKAATSTIPILFIAGFDPVKLGLVNRLNRPGGNATGLSLYTTELLAKRLEFLSELVPRTNSVALLVNPLSPAAGIETEDMEGLARASGLRLVALQASDEGEVKAAFASAVRDRVDALLMSADPFFTTRRAQIVALAVHHGLPVVYPWREYAEIGGLMSYGPNLRKAYHEIGLYAGRILNGDNPGELPVQLPTSFELVINQRTATALGLKISRLLQVRADKIVE
jgi:putative ABC transport system substrate-binding protein